MLSRLAETSFWLGRYLERAEGMSRLLVEFHQLLVQDNRAHVKRGCTLISHGLGLEGDPKSARELVALAYGEPLNPGTLLGSIHSARSNARLIRDILPSDFYQAINQLNATSSDNVLGYIKVGASLSNSASPPTPGYQNLGTSGPGQGLGGGGMGGINLPSKSTTTITAS